MGSVPKLRFPEFSESWQNLPVGAFIEDYKNKSTIQDEYIVFTSSRQGLIRQSEYYEKSRITERDNIGYHIIPPNHLTYRSRSDDRRFFFNENLTNETGIISYYYPVFRIVNGANNFFKEMFRHYQFFIGKFAVGTSQTVLSHGELKKIKLPIPSKEEQTKIAEFLGAVDKKIYLLQSRHEQLTFYKKGVIQKIFSQELRFKQDDGSEFPDWEANKIGSALKESRITGSKGNKAKKLSVKLWKKGVVAKELLGSVNTQYYIRRSGQFMYSKLDFLNSAFGIIPKELDGFESTVDLPSFDISNKFSAKFLLELISRKNFYKRLGDIADGSRKAKRIHVDTFLGFSANIPSLPEQQKIANFLSAIDDKIDAVSTQIENMQSFKKGLLQQMFV